MNATCRVAASSTDPTLKTRTDLYLWLCEVARPRRCVKHRLRTRCIQNCCNDRDAPARRQRWISKPSPLACMLSPGTTNVASRPPWRRWDDQFNRSRNRRGVGVWAHTALAGHATPTAQRPSRAAQGVAIAGDLEGGSPARSRLRIGTLPNLTAIIRCNSLLQAAERASPGQGPHITSRRTQLKSVADVLL